VNKMVHSGICASQKGESREAPGQTIRKRTIVLKLDAVRNLLTKLHERQGLSALVAALVKDCIAILSYVLACLPTLGKYRTRDFL